MPGRSAALPAPSCLLAAALWCGVCAALLPCGASPAVEVPLPYGSLRKRDAPKAYAAHRCTPGGISIDGSPDEPCWRAAPRSDAFVDIVGPTGPAPWFATHVRMLWDDTALYIAAELEDTRMFAQQTLHDSIIYTDNDFEVFIDPDADNTHYYEVEVNARGAVWDLLLTRPYRNGGAPVMNWETIRPAVDTMQSGPTGWQPMQVAVQVNGSLDAREGSRGWTVEMALPWSLLRHAASRQTPPSPGDQWRINFSRVHYNVTWSEDQQRYVKQPPDQPGYNWVWSPQWQVAMHQPETWGYVQFEDTPACPDPTWPARALLVDVYHAQTLCWQAHGRFCAALSECKQLLDLADVPDDVVTIHTTQVTFVASTLVRLHSGDAVLVMVDQFSRITQAPAVPSAEGHGYALPGFNPFEGRSSGAAGSTSSRSEQCQRAVEW